MSVSEYIRSNNVFEQFRNERVTDNTLIQEAYYEFMPWFRECYPGSKMPTWSLFRKEILSK